MSIFGHTSVFAIDLRELVNWEFPFFEGGLPHIETIDIDYEEVEPITNPARLLEYKTKTV